MSNRPTRKDILRQRKTVTFVGRERQLELFQTNLDLGEREAALACYRRSLELFEDKAEFFKGMEDDWQHPAQHGIGREAYEGVQAELRAA